MKRLSILALGLVAWMLCLQRFYLLDSELGAFVDEMINLLAPLNWLRYGVYSPHAPVTGYEISVSSGPLATLPSALGWLTFGNLFGARLFFFLNSVLIYLLSARLYLKRFQPALKEYFWPLTGFLFLILIKVVPYADAASTQIIGEFPGFMLLLLGVVTLEARPKLGALILGFCVWHAKFIYFPFALIALAARAKTLEAQGSKKAFAKHFLSLMGIAQLPLLFWAVAILLTAGGAAVLHYFTYSYHLQTDVFLNYSSLPHPSSQEAAVTGLMNRLHSPSLEWVKYSLRFKAFILLFLFGPIPLLGWQLFQSRAEKGSGRNVLLSGLVITLIGFAAWYFLFHRFMWVRHILPALLVGWAVFIHFSFNQLKGFPPKRLAWVFFPLSLLIGIKESSKLTHFYSTDRSSQYSFRCKADKPWEVSDQDLIEILCKE